MLAGGRRPPGRPRLADLTEPTDLAILKAAAQLFMDHGYRGVTMDMVAEAADLTKAAVYYYFHDKASLVVAMLGRTFAAARSGTEEILSQPRPLMERLVAMAEVVLGLPQPFIAFNTLMHEAATELSDVQIQVIREAEASVTAPLEQAVLKAAASGEIMVEDPLLLAHAFVAALRVGQTLTLDGRPRFPDRRRTARVLVTVLWQGVAPA